VTLALQLNTARADVRCGDVAGLSGLEFGSVEEVSRHAAITTATAINVAAAPRGIVLIGRLWRIVVVAAFWRRDGFRRDDHAPVGVKSRDTKL